MNKLEFEEYYTKCKTIWEHYGKETQLNQLIEECSELIRAIIRKDRANILEELADVQVLIDQLSIAYPEFDDCIDPLKMHKVDRQLRRIRIETGKTNGVK
jgi:phosphoribosyl-ATP pyrophosphohydrolase